jgi:hypothetical protein
VSEPEAGSSLALFSRIIIPGDRPGLNAREELARSAKRWFRAVHNHQI